MPPPWGLKSEKRTTFLSIKLKGPDRGSPEPQRVRGKVMEQARVMRPCSRRCCGSGEPRSVRQFPARRLVRPSPYLTFLLFSRAA